MKNSLALTRSIGFRFLALCASTLLFICFAQGQSADDVHILPRNGPHSVDSIANTVPMDGLPTLNPHGKPVRVNVELVLVPGSVNDAMNRPVITLKKEDFALYEEDKQQEIRYFSAEESPISVAILLDVSKSMSDKIYIERAAIVEFFKNANPDDEYFAITFSDHPRLIAGPTRSIDDVERRLIAVEPGGPTALLDAIYLAEIQLRTARCRRKAIVIISDGGDNASRYNLSEIKSLIQESDVQIYAIGLFDTFFFNTLEERLGKKWLDEITDRTGGRTVTVDNRAKLPKSAAANRREMRNQYV